MQQSLEGKRERLISAADPQGPHGARLRELEAHADLEEALGFIFGCFREGFGPLKFFFSSLFPPWDCWGRHQRRQIGRKEKRLAAGRKS